MLKSLGNQGLPHWFAVIAPAAGGRDQQRTESREAVEAAVVCKWFTCRLQGSQWQ
jgi:hypothetical protein